MPKSKGINSKYNQLPIHLSVFATHNDNCLLWMTLIKPTNPEHKFEVTLRTWSVTFCEWWLTLLLTLFRVGMLKEEVGEGEYSASNVSLGSVPLLHRLGMLNGVGSERGTLTCQWIAKQLCTKHWLKNLTYWYKREMTSQIRDKWWVEEFGPGNILLQKINQINSQ